MLTPLQKNELTQWRNDLVREYEEMETKLKAHEETVERVTVRAEVLKDATPYIQNTVGQEVSGRLQSAIQEHDAYKHLADSKMNEIRNLVARIDSYIAANS